MEQRSGRGRRQGDDLEQRKDDDGQWDDGHRGHDGAVAPVLPKLLAVDGPHADRAHAHVEPASTSSSINSRWTSSREWWDSDRESTSPPAATRARVTAGSA